MTTLDAARFRQVMGRHAAGVSILTTVHDGIDHAMTADTLTSVSLDPLLVLVCVEVESRFHGAITEAGTFGASILAVDQRALCDWFATRGRPLHGQLDRAPHHRGPATGVALLDRSLAALEAVVEAVHPAGDHSVVLGRVVGLELPDDTGSALIHYRGSYGSLT